MTQPTSAPPPTPEPSRRTVPRRVFALRDATAEIVHLFGFGIYVGDRVPNWVGSAPDESTRQMMVEVLAETDAREPFGISIIDWQVDQGSLAPSEAEAGRKAVYARREAEQARPLEDRIAEQWQRLSSNPCIELDDGNTVWGAQCWWENEDLYDKTVGGRSVVVVPVPAENERWKP